MSSYPNQGTRPQRGDAQSHIQRAAVLWAQAREASSSSTRIELERLALLYERLAVRAARREPNSSTLGELIHDDNAKSRVAEAAWVALLQRVARRDQRSLRTLYLWTHRLVLTLIARIINDWGLAEQLTVEAFCDLPQRVGTFDSMSDSVIGWIMKLARNRALAYLRNSRRCQSRRSDPAFAAPVLEMIVDWPTNVLPFSAPLWQRVAARMAAEDNVPAFTDLPSGEKEPAWQQPAPGIYCKLLATDTQRGRVSLLVRLAPGIEYPPHMHTGVEELHLLQGELWIDDRKLCPGDYHRAEPGTTDHRVWSETGCACLLMTSSRDIIGAR